MIGTLATTIISGNVVMHLCFAEPDFACITASETFHKPEAAGISAPAPPPTRRSDVVNPTVVNPTYRGRVVLAADVSRKVSGP